MTTIEQRRLPVLLSVQGQQLYDGADPDETELLTLGYMELLKDGKILLEYQETELTGMEGTTTRFEVEASRVILSRSGSVNSQMVFQEGQPHSSVYETPFGELLVTIQTSRLRHNLTQRGGVMDIWYSIAMEHKVTGRNRFKIRVKPQN